VPSLPGAISQGRTKAEAIQNIREAIDLVIEVMREHGDPIPEDALDAVLVAV
jgi:predicted RNase H-like HicB family nuclease